MEEKTLIQDENDCSIWLADAMSASRQIAARVALGRGECPLQPELDNFIDYFMNPFYYLLRGEEKYAEDWLDLYDAICLWLVKNN